MLWLLALLASSGQGAVGDHVWCHTLPLHCFECIPSLLWLLALSASTDQGAVGDHVGYHTLRAVYPERLTNQGSPEDGRQRRAHALRLIDGPSAPVGLCWERQLGYVLKGCTNT